MLITSMLFLLGNPAAPAPKPVLATTDDPPIRVWLDDSNYQPGDRATVKIRLADDGYVVVLRADARGHLRVLFPLDPGTDNYVKGGKTFEIRGRGDREAFQVDDEEGTGTIFAAVSAQPYSFTGYVLGDHWDYRQLAAQNIGDDPEADLVDLVHTMAGGNHFDYDVTTYNVSTQSTAAAYPTTVGYPDYFPCWGCGPWYPGGGVFIGVGFGGPYYGGSCWADPFWCDYYGGYGWGYGYGWRHGFYHPFYPHYTIYNTGYRPFGPSRRPPFVIPSRTVVHSVPVRPRFEPRTPTPVARDEGRRGGSPRPESRPANPGQDGRGGRGGRGGREAPPPRTSGRHDESWSRPAAPAPRPEYRPAPRPQAPAPRPEYRSAPAPRPQYHPAPAPRSAPRSAPPARSGGGGGGGGRGGRHR